MKLVKDTENDSYYYYGFIKPVKAGVYRGTAQLVQNGVTSVFLLSLKLLFLLMSVLVPLIFLTQW